MKTKLVLFAISAIMAFTVITFANPPSPVIVPAVAEANYIAEAQGAALTIISTKSEEQMIDINSPPATKRTVAIGNPNQRTIDVNEATSSATANNAANLAANNSANTDNAAGMDNGRTLIIQRE